MGRGWKARVETGVKTRLIFQRLYGFEAHGERLDERVGDPSLKLGHSCPGEGTRERLSCWQVQLGEMEGLHANSCKYG